MGFFLYKIQFTNDVIFQLHHLWMMSYFIEKPNLSYYVYELI